MELTNYLATIWGLSIVVISIALLVRPNYLKKLAKIAEDEALLFVCGIATLAIGIATVLAHNTWVKDWPVIITIFGWIALIKGLSIMFFPGFTKKITLSVIEYKYISYVLLVASIIGLIITYLGFTS